MKERPILFSAPMVRAILEGRKTMTRRVVKVQPLDEGYKLSTCFSSTDCKCEGKHRWAKMVDYEDIGGDNRYFPCPYGVPGDILWVKETHYLWGAWHKNGLTKTRRQKWRFRYDKSKGVRFPDAPPTEVCKGRSGTGWFKRSSMFMPLWACRTKLKMTDVRVERLQDISEEDAKAEGAPQPDAGAFGKVTARSGFQWLWNHLNASRGYGWDANPWVWVVSSAESPLEPRWTRSCRPTSPRPSTTSRGR